MSEDDTTKPLRAPWPAAISTPTVRPVDWIDADGSMTLTAREVVTLVYLLDGMGDDAAVARVFGTRSDVRITPERARQIRSRLMTRLRGAAGTGPYGDAVRAKPTKGTEGADR